APGAIRAQRPREVVRTLPRGPRPGARLVRSVGGRRHGARLSRPGGAAPCGRPRGLLVGYLRLVARVGPLCPAREIRPTRRFCRIWRRRSIRLGRGHLVFGITSAAPPRTLALGTGSLGPPCGDLRFDAGAQLLLVAHRGTVA